MEWPVQPLRPWPGRASTPGMVQQKTDLCLCASMNRLDDMHPRFNMASVVDPWAFRRDATLSRNSDWLGHDQASASERAVTYLRCISFAWQAILGRASRTR